MVMGYIPAATVEATVKVAVELPLPGATIGLGLKLTVMPVGAPLEDKATAELKAFNPVVVMIELPEPPAEALALGEAEMVKSGEGVTVTLTVALWVSAAAVPVMVIG
jgi:hypothetical protein